MINFQELRKTLTKKRSSARVRQFCNILNEALSSAEPLFKTDSVEQDCEEFWFLMRHAEFLWNDSVLLLRQGSYASSVFFAIICLEEIGKLSIARFQIAVNEHERRNGKTRTRQSSKNPTYSHHKKHQVAAFSGFAINSRADRILGLSNIMTLLDLAENGKLEVIRQNSVYSRPQKGSITLPLTSRKKEDAVFFCSVVGELLAEIGGFDPYQFERLLALVKKFEEEFPLNKYQLKMAD